MAVHSLVLNRAEEQLSEEVVSSHRLSHGATVPPTSASVTALGIWATAWAKKTGAVPIKVSFNNGSAAIDHLHM